MKNYLFALLSFFMVLAVTGSANAQTKAETKARYAGETSAPTYAHHEPAGTRLVYFDEKGQHSKSAELNKYEIRRCRVLGAITASDAHMIRQRKRRAQRQENAYLKAEAAKLHNEDTDLASR